MKPAGTVSELWFLKFPHLCRRPEINSFLLKSPGWWKIFLNGRFATPPVQRCGRCSGSVCRRHPRAGGNLPVYKCNLNITIACIYLSVFEGLTCCLCAPPPRRCRRNLGGGACFPWFALDLGELTLQRFYGLDLVCEKCSTDVSLFL